MASQILTQGETIDGNIDFNAFNDPLVDIDVSDNKFDVMSESWSGYVPIRFSNEDGTSFMYGWAEIEASVELVNGTPDDNDYSRVVFEIKRMAYEGNWDQPIAAGAIPEPSVIILVLCTGLGILSARRIFPNLENGKAE